MKNLMKTFRIMMMLVLSLLIFPLSANAEETIKEYTVIYRPGNIAKFSEELIQKYEERYGEDKVSVSQVTGSISITVPAGVYYPEAPQASEIVLDEAHQGRYYVTTGWIPTDEIVMQDDDYVVDYGALVDAVDYTIRYVDKETGMDLATPLMSQGNAGDKITAAAKVIENYTWDEYLSEMTLDKEGENVLIFSYTYSRSPQYETIYLEGETIYTTVVLPGRVVPGSSTGGNGNAGNQDQENEGDQGNEGGQENEGGENEDGQNDNEGSEVEDDQNNPENQGGENTGDEGDQNENEDVIVDIDDPEVPLAQMENENAVKTGLIIAGIVALGLLAAFTASRMRKNKESEED